MQQTYQQWQQSKANQASGTQQSAGLPKVKGPEMNDRDRINDCLALEKYLSYGYNVALNEAGNQQLFQMQFQMLNEIHQAQRDCYNLMKQKGWYKIDNADLNKVSQKAQQFANYRTQFPY
ncbi:spore coat protein [Paenactinomyces guangxiensis]|uniref:Spore coat protein n=1 Tax=Paenactinomyces guangxiensis TaxID=1490290 RepID=A0A7W1WPU3_9BACL|nr:spore coat protein [Paenactinomyces guangxiensis]MBA4493708.1 spore coat protein [Paenactinomyces guangxiensis]MBH8590995.1 spore coat protein [Paenactinomyces guangxiensis]